MIDPGQARPHVLAGGERRRLLGAAQRVRETILDTVLAAGSGHVGAALSQADLLVALYLRVLRVDPARPDWPERDRFVLSKGHGGLGLCAVLAEAGFLAREELRAFGRTGARLGMHMDRTKVPGIEVSTGSLGHGLGMAVGMALGARLQGQTWRTVCLASDGELYEGSTWEAALAAGGFKLRRLTLVVDRNRLTMDGFTEEELPLEPVADKLTAFGWRVLCVDGHDLDAVCGALEAAPDAGERPTAVVAATVKGKGVAFMEDQPRWHYGALDTEAHARALESVRAYHAALDAAGGPPVLSKDASTRPGSSSVLAER